MLIHKRLPVLEFDVRTDDPTLLTLFVGEQFQGPKRIVTESDIRTFGALTHNEQWIHTDKERAVRESPYGDLVAHAVLLVGLVPSLMPQERFSLTGYTKRIVRGFDNLRFPGPVYPGEYVHLSAVLQAAYRARSGKGLVLSRKISLSAVNRENEPALVGTLHYQYF